MPADKDFKRLVRARMGRTGESYTTARSHLRPDGDPGRPDRLRGRHPDTAALTRLLAALGVTDPAGGRPLSEAMVLGVAGGIGFAYFVFEYEDLTTLYLGGRINPYVHKRDAAEAALTRLGVPFQVRRTSGPAAAERHLRTALDQGRPVVATVDGARLRSPGRPARAAGDDPPGRAGRAARRRAGAVGPGPGAGPGHLGRAGRGAGPGSARPSTGWSSPSPGDFGDGLGSSTARSTCPARPPPGSPTPGRACWTRRCATSASPAWPSGPTS